MSPADGLLATAVREHFPGSARVTALPGGSANVMVAVDAGGQQVLRIYLERDYPRFHCEVATLEALEKIGAPTPRVSTWGRACPVFGTPYLIYSMIPGMTLARAASVLPIAQLAQLVGPTMECLIRCAEQLPTQTVGYLHTAESRHRGRTPHDVERYGSIIATNELLPPSLLDRVLAAVDRHGHLVETDSPGVVHPDVKPANVIVGDGTTSVIDWELTVGGHPLLTYGGLLSEGVTIPPLRSAIRHHLDDLGTSTRLGALAAGMLRALEALSYLPSNPTHSGGRKVRLDKNDLRQSVETLTEWLKS